MIWTVIIAVLALFVGYYAGVKNEQALERVRRKVREEQVRKIWNGQLSRWKEFARAEDRARERERRPYQKPVA